MHYSEEDGMGDDVPDTTDISTKKAKAQNLMNLLSNYSAWFVDGHLMMPTAEATIPRTRHKRA